VTTFLSVTVATELQPTSNVDAESTPELRFGIRGSHKMTLLFVSRHKPPHASALCVRNAALSARLWKACVVAIGPSFIISVVYKLTSPDERVATKRSPVESKQIS
jgi:hypothetical protein